MKGKQAVITARRARWARPPPGDSAPRERLLQAAFTVFREHGFADASTLEIATRAQASKRDLYAVFDSKQAMLAACITERAHRMRQPLNLASEVPESREALEATLVQFGKSILRGLSDPMCWRYTDLRSPNQLGHVWVMLCESKVIIVRRQSFPFRTGSGHYSILPQKKCLKPKYSGRCERRCIIERMMGMF
jgi:AcrR family transcriptional regulator